MSATLDRNPLSPVIVRLVQDTSKRTRGRTLLVRPQWKNRHLFCLRHFLWNPMLPRDHSGVFRAIPSISGCLPWTKETAHRIWSYSAIPDSLYWLGPLLGGRA